MSELNNEYIKYLDASEEMIKNAFIELLERDMAMSEAELNLANKIKEKDSPLSVSDLGVLASMLNPQELQNKLGEIQKQRAKNVSEAELEFKKSQQNFRRIGIICDGIKVIVQNRNVGK